jgi:hypothetical protein
MPKNNMTQILTIFIFPLSVFCGFQITQNCRTCSNSSQDCLVWNGGPFNNVLTPIETTECGPTNNPNYLTTYTFSCGGAACNTCDILIRQPGGNVYSCGIGPSLIVML